VLEALLQDKKGVQEQAVLGLGSNGGQQDVLPVAKQFFATNNGVFRLSCLHALAMMSLDRDADVAGVLRENSAVFGEAKQANVKHVTERLVRFQELRDLVKRLDAPDAEVRRQASGALRERTQQRIEFNADGDEASRAQAIRQWREYLLKDYWRGPVKPKPPQPAPAGTP
jgi:hypothetical protein